jgi:sulfite reductase (NADPH) hemoprotein beta-component
VTIGGRADEEAELGKLIGPAVPYGEVANVVEDIVAAYVELRDRPGEIFIDTLKRVGIEPFKERVHATH